VYADLFEAIGTNWGEGTGPDAATKFKIPELRGWFLRGWSGDTNFDLDKNTRININNPQQQIGNVVGSYQNFAVESHIHQISTRPVPPGIGPGNYVGRANGANIILETTSAYGGSETRPQNASVLYIIKY
jgi:hypothetical protein